MKRDLRRAAPRFYSDVAVPAGLLRGVGCRHDSDLCPTRLDLARCSSRQIPSQPVACRGHRRNRINHRTLHSHALHPENLIASGEPPRRREPALHRWQNRESKMVLGGLRVPLHSYAALHDRAFHRRRHGAHQTVAHPHSVLSRTAYYRRRSRLFREVRERKPLWLASRRGELENRYYTRHRPSRYRRVPLRRLAPAPRTPETPLPLQDSQELDRIRFSPLSGSRASNTI